MLDAYTVKKAIPRVLIAVIAINLSIYLCVAALDITTIIGRGLNSLLVTPFIDQGTFNGTPIESNAENGILGVLGTVGALGGLFGLIASGAAGFIWLLGVLLPLMITIALITLAVLFTLIIRQGLLIFLSVISPLAIACYILPGTEKYFKQWWDLFLKTLMVYPIIAAIFAMSNVLAAILLNTAAGSASMLPGAYFAAGQSDTIGTLQIFVVILVLYAPLVLIPFAFKLAGGAIGAVMNAASGRAANLSGRAGQAIQKNRQDPNTWLGSRTARAKQNRVDRNFTPGQIIAGTAAGVGARARGKSFRTGYGLAAGAMRESSVFDQASAYMENNAAFKAVSGNDDSLWAFMNGNSSSEVEAILRRRNPTLPDRDIQETTAMVMRAKNQVGQRVGEIAATRAQAKTGTGFEDNAQMLSEVVRASGGDMNTAGRMLAEMRGSAVQGGQMQLGTSGFATQMGATAELREAMTSGDPTQIAAATQSANKKVMRSVIDSNTGGAAVHGKPSSATSIARAHKEKINDFLQSMSTGRATDVNGQTRVANARDIKQAMASAHGLHDAMRGATPQNQRAFADELMGEGIVTTSLSNEAKAALGFDAIDKASVGPDGNLTYRQVMEGLAGRDQEYGEMRHDYASQSASEAEALRNQAGITGQQSNTTGVPGQNI